MNINMIPFSEDLELSEGKYLVKTVSLHKCGSTSWKHEQFLEVKLSRVFNKEKNKTINSLDMSNQVTTLISEKPLF